MQPQPETAFTRRMRRLCAEAAPSLPAQAISRLCQLLDRASGNFVPTAKLLLQGPMPPTLPGLARADELHYSLEWIILNEPEWNELFTTLEREIARLRLETARHLAAEGDVNA